jgi:hypothetical protein
MTSTKNKESPKSSNKSSPKKATQSSDNLYLIVFTIVIVVTFATRFYKVTEPDHVW